MRLTPRSVVLSILLFSVLPLCAEEPRDHEFRALVSSIRLNSDLIAQGKKQDDEATVTLPAILFESPLRIDDVRNTDPHSREEINTVVSYTRANLEGTVSDILSFWMPEEREAKSALLKDPNIFKKNREYHEGEPGLTLIGLIFQERTTSVLVRRSRGVIGINLVAVEGGFRLTDHASDDLEVAIVEASLSRR